jgi:hypothetical protein
MYTARLTHPLLSMITVFPSDQASLERFRRFSKSFYPFFKFLEPYLHRLTLFSSLKPFSKSGIRLWFQLTRRRTIQKCLYTDIRLTKPLATKSLRVTLLFYPPLHLLDLISRLLLYLPRLMALHRLELPNLTYPRSNRLILRINTSSIFLGLPRSLRSFGKRGVSW